MKTNRQHFARIFFLFILLIIFSMPSWAAWNPDGEIKVSYYDNKVEIKIMVVNKAGEDHAMDYLSMKIDAHNVFQLWHNKIPEGVSSDNYSFLLDESYKIGYKKDPAKFYYNYDGKWEIFKLSDATFSLTEETDAITFKMVVPAYFFPLDEATNITFYTRTKEYDTDYSDEIKYSTYSPSLMTPFLKEYRTPDDPDFAKDENFKAITATDENLEIKLLYVNANGSEPDHSMQKTILKVKFDGVEKTIATINHTPSSNTTGSDKVRRTDYKIGYENDPCTYTISPEDGWEDLKFKSEAPVWTTKEECTGILLWKNCVDKEDELRDIITIPVASIPKKYHGKNVQIKAAVEWKKYEYYGYEKKILYKEFGSNEYILNIPDFEAYNDLKADNFTCSWNENDNRIDIKYFTANTTGGIASYGRDNPVVNGASALKDDILTIDGKVIESATDGITLTESTIGTKTYKEWQIEKIDTAWFGETIACKLTGSLDLNGKTKEVNVSNQIEIEALIHKLTSEPTYIIDCSGDDRKIKINYNWDKGSYYSSEIKASVDGSDLTLSEHKYSSPGGSFEIATNEFALPNTIDIDFKVKFNEFSDYAFITKHVSVSSDFVAEIWNGSLEVSKGYHREKVKISWNPEFAKTTFTYHIERRNLSLNSVFQEIGTTINTVHNYEDKDIIPGNYYEYIVYGKSACSDISDTIKGIGFIKANAYIAGSISFDGESPVEGAKVRAYKESEIKTFSLTGEKNKNPWASIPVPKLEEANLNNELSLGFWFKFKEGKNEGTLLSIGADGNLLNAYLKIGLDIDNKPWVAFNDRTDYKSSFTSAKSFDEVKFYQMYLVIDADSIKIFVDGENCLRVERPKNDSAIHITADGILNIGHRVSGLIDEVSLWKTAKTDEEVKAIYSKYLTGTEKNLIGYWSFEEGVHGVNDTNFNEIYDYSQTASIYNKQNGNIHAGGAFSEEFPSDEELNYCDFTDEYGSYSISFPISGNMELISIKPSFNVHKFSPEQKTIGVSSTNPVHNDVNFSDVSYFKASGRALYRTYGIFDSSEEGESITSPVTLMNNKYKIGVDRVENSGEFYYDFESKKLYKTPIIPLKGAGVYIDNKPVLDQGDSPVLTDAEGNFSITIPLGDHYVSVKKDGHSFNLNGQYPAPTEDSPYEKRYFDADIQDLIFLDTTTVLVRGRVIGGTVEPQKVLGFNKSKNNIGQAEITFKYNDINNPVGLTVTTDTRSGEYLVKLLPIDNLSITNVVIPKNKDIKFSAVKDDVALAFNLSAFIESKKIYDETDPTKKDSVSYNRIQNFTYRSKPKLKIMNADEIGEKVFDISDKPLLYANTDTLIFNSGETYNVEFKAVEAYTNFDSITEGVLIEEDVQGGQVVINNNLAFAQQTKLEANENGYFLYQFRAGTPSVGCSVKDMIATFEAENYTPDDDGKQSIQGILLGDIPKSGTNFITAGPVFPKFILRDPPGSNSYAYLSEGATLSTSSSMSVTDSHSHDVAVTVGTSANMWWTSWENSVKGSFSYSASSTNGRTLDESISMNTTVQTSDETDYVGAMGDVYYGLSHNYSFSKTQHIEVLPLADTMKTENVIAHLPGNPTYVFYLNEGIMLTQATEPVWYVYSQNHIINYLIPNYLDILSTKFNYTDSHLDDLVSAIFENSVLSDSLLLKSNSYEFPEVDEDDLKTAIWYEEQIAIWQKTIAANEHKKLLAYQNKLQDFVQDNIDLKVAALREGLDSLKTQITANDYEGNLAFDDMQRTLERQIDEYEKNLSTYEENAKKNISFDAGVGEYSSELTTEKIITDSYEWTAGTEVGLNLSMKYSFSSVSVGGETNNTWTDESGGTNESTTTNTTTFGYVLKDSDQGDYLSVDVYNDMSGNGPIFVTRGGQTMCPYEGETNSQFVILKDDNGNVIPLSAGTLMQEKPEILVIGEASKTGIPDNIAAEFTLQFNNLSETEADLWYSLTVDEGSNDGAILKIDGNNPNGMFMVKYGVPMLKTLTVRKGKVDENSYQNIGLILHSPCQFENGDGLDIADTTWVSVEFIPTCSNISVLSPKNNWVVNTEKIKNDGDILKINLGDYNRESTTFKKIELRYRAQNSIAWETIATFYNKPTRLDSLAIKNTPLSNFEIIAAESEYTWDISSIADGKYEIQAVSICGDESDVNSIFETYSDIHLGTIDRKRPEVFGTPSPADGILSANDDIIVHFNEDILSGPINADNITINYQASAFDKDHSVSALFDGNNNNVKIESVPINGSFSLEFWAKNIGLEDSIIIKQGNANATDMKIGFEENRLFIKLDTKKFSATKDANSLDQWQHYSFIYNQESNYVSIYQNENCLLDKAEVSATLTYQSSLNLLIGNSFVGNLNALKLWSYPLLSKDILIYNVPTGYESGLSGYWPLEEGAGTVCKDLAQSNHAISSANWEVNPKGISYYFDGSKQINIKPSNIITTKNQDFTIEFWFKPNALQNASLLSNGHGMGGDFGLASETESLWSINTDEDGFIYVNNNNVSIKATNKTYNDNQWHHFALVMSRRGNLISYLDGSVQSVTSSNDKGGFYSANLTLGARKWFSIEARMDSNNYYTGYLDEVKIWQIAKTEKQITRDMRLMSEKSEPYLLMNIPFQVIVDGEVKPNNYNYVENDLVNASQIFDFANGSFDEQDSPIVKVAQPRIKLSEYSLVTTERSIFIKPSDFNSLEGKLLDISIKKEGIKDLYENEMASAVTWTALVDKNQLKWGEQSRNLSIEAGRDTTISVRIINKGGTSQLYSISGFPSWISIEESQAEIVADSYKDITISISDAANIGEYNEILYLEGSNGIKEKFILNIDVFKKAPDWSVNQNDYFSSMGIIGMLKIDGIISSDKHDLVAAFVNTECRGVGQMKYIAQLDSYRIFMDIYGASDETSKLDFKVWDASKGEILAEVEPDLNFEANEVFGSVSNPQILNAKLTYERTIPLNTGWNWFSYNLVNNQDNLEDFFKISKLPEEFYIKNDVAYSSLSADKNWKGTLGALNYRSMYMIKVSEPTDIIVTGAKIDLSTTNIDIEKGWNMISYLPVQNQSVSDALGTLTTISEGDIIKGQVGFSIYDPILGWVGSLTYMKQGKGYKLRVTNTGALKYRNLDFTAFKNETVSSDYENQQPDLERIWPNKNKSVSNNMSLIAVLDQSNAEMFQNSAVGAFINNECRGIATPIEINEQLYYFVSINGDFNNEQVSFNIIDLESLQEYQLQEKMEFGVDYTVGSLESPFVLSLANTITGLGSISDQASEISCYPNPFKNETFIDFSCAKSSEIQVEVFNLLGLRVANLLDVKNQNGQFHVAWDGKDQFGNQLSSAQYIIKISINGIATTKLIQKL